MAVTEALLPVERDTKASFKANFAALCQREASFAWENSTDLMVDFATHFIPSQSFIAKSREDKLNVCLLRWNPLWYLSILGCAVCLVPGHAFHHMLGQGDELRSDEHPLERKVRVGWIYTYSGALCVTCIMDLEVLVYHFFVPDSSQYQQIRAAFCAILMQLWYVIGGCYFLLRNMKQRNTLLMHSCVMSQIMFGLAFTIMFFFTLRLEWDYRGAIVIWISFRKAHWTMSTWDLIKWSLRLFYCFLMGVSYIGLTPLLRCRYILQDNSESNQDVFESDDTGMWKLKVLTVLGAVTVIAGVHVYFDWNFWRVFVPACFVIGFLLTPACMMTGRFTKKEFFACIYAQLPLYLVAASFIWCKKRIWVLLSGF